MRPAPDRPGKLPSLLPVLGFLRPYKLRLVAASLALLFTAGATLSLGRGLQVLIDDGFASGDSAQLRSAIILLIAIRRCSTISCACTRVFSS